MSLLNSHEDYSFVSETIIQIKAKNGAYLNISLSKGQLSNTVNKWYYWLTQNYQFREWISRRICEFYLLFWLILETMPNI